MDTMFEISLDKICHVISLARELSVPHDFGGDEDSEPDRAAEVDFDTLEARRSDSVYDEMVEFINDLNEDEALDLVALMWIGRGTFDADEWEEARNLAREEATHSYSDYLLGTPLLADFLESGLDAFDLSCEGEA